MVVYELWRLFARRSPAGILAPLNAAGVLVGNADHVRDRAAGDGVRGWSVCIRFDAWIPACCSPRPPTSQEVTHIADNSFLVEEAYNQEAGVVQHVSTFSRPEGGGAWDSGSPRNGRSAACGTS